MKTKIVKQYNLFEFSLWIEHLFFSIGGENTEYEDEDKTQTCMS